jgi:hypothetical protein
LRYLNNIRSLRKSVEVKEKMVNVQKNITLSKAVPLHAMEALGGRRV